MTFFVCQDTQIQVVVVGAGRADLVAQTKARRLFFRMEAQNSDSWRWWYRAKRRYTLWIMDGSFMDLSSQ